MAPPEEVVVVVIALFRMLDDPVDPDAPARPG